MSILGAKIEKAVPYMRVTKVYNKKLRYLGLSKQMLQKQINIIFFNFLTKDSKSLKNFTECLENLVFK